MNCPDCASRLSVWDSGPSPEGGTVRELRCLCGGRFLSVEAIARRLPSLGTGTPPVPHGYPARTQEGDRYPTGTPPVPSRGSPPGTRTPPVPGGGVGGGLSGDRSGSLPDRNPTSPGDPGRARARSPKPPPDTAAPKYPEAFEELWAATGRRGGKDAAHRAWVKMGRWPWRQVREAWEAYMLSDRPARLGAVQDLSTWLNGRGHQQEWPRAAAPVSREERERLEARERDRIASERRIAETNRKLAAERDLKARLDAQAAAGAPAAPPLDIRSHVAGLAAQKSAETLDEDERQRARR